MSQYLQDKNPYTREYYASYDQTLRVVKKVLKNNNWKIAKTTDPSVYEEVQSERHPASKQTIILTELKETSMFLYSRYTQLNVYVRSLQNATEVEIRYGVITALPLKQLRGYRNDHYANRLLDQIATALGN